MNGGGGGGRKREEEEEDTGSSIQTGKKYDDTVALWGFMETHTWS